MLIVVLQIRVANVFQEPGPVTTKLPYRGKPSFASMVAMAARASANNDSDAAPNSPVSTVSPQTESKAAPQATSPEKTLPDGTADIANVAV